MYARDQEETDQVIQASIITSLGVNPHVVFILLAQSVMAVEEILGNKDDLFLKAILASSCSFPFQYD